MADEKAKPEVSGEKSPRRKVQGNLPYMTNHGRIKPVLEKMITAAKPDRLTQDYLDKIFGLPAGTYKTVLPILRRVGLIGADGTPTQLYDRFRSNEGRPGAVFKALETGFPELFKRSEHIYAANDAKLSDTIAEATGLGKADPIVSAIRGTFRAFSGYLPDGFSSTDANREVAPIRIVEPDLALNDAEERKTMVGRLNGISYHINIVVPETKDAEVYNLIFRSLRENLLTE